MTPREEFYLKMGFLDCFQAYAQSQATNPDQAIMKRMYVQEKMIADVLSDTPREEILKMIDELNHKKLTEEMILKYIKPRVEMEKMMDILKDGKFTSFSKLGI